MLKKLMQSFRHFYMAQTTRRAERLFHWTGLSALGELKSGHIAARSRQEARQQLHAQTLIIKTLSSSSYWSRPLKPRDITHLLHQLNRILDTGISMVQALPILLSCQTHVTLVTLVKQIQHHLESGASFSECLAQHPRWFDSMTCALVHLGEHTGALIPILDKIVTHQNQTLMYKQQFRSLLIYPTAVVGMGSMVTVYLLLTVVPQLQAFFQQAHQALPWTTRMLLNITHWLKIYGIGTGSCLVLSGFYLKKSLNHCPTLKYGFDLICLKIPVIGHLYQAMYLTRAFYALTMAQEAGLPLPDGLQWIALITNNLCYKRAFLQMRSAVQHGESIRSAILRTQIFPQLAIQLLSLGEQSGTLSRLSNDLAQYYQQSVEQTLQHLSRYIEPAFMIVLGVIIGSLILCMYLPMIQLGALL